MRRISLCCCLASLVIATSAVAMRATEPASPPRSRAAPNSADGTQRADATGGSQHGLVPFFVEQIKVRRNRYPGNEGKNHIMVKAPFREVVADAGQSTVQVRCDDKAVALGTVVSADGYIVTKASELVGGVVCKLPNDQTYPAQVIGVHEDTD